MYNQLYDVQSFSLLVNDLRGMWCWGDTSMIIACSFKYHLIYCNPLFLVELRVRRLTATLEKLLRLFSKLFCPTGEFTVAKKCLFRRHKARATCCRWQGMAWRRCVAEYFVAKWLISGMDVNCVLYKPIQSARSGRAKETRRLAIRYRYVYVVFHYTLLLAVHCG